MPVFKNLLITLSLLFLLFSQIQAQNSAVQAEENIISYTERKLGPDDLLVNGTRYLPENLHATGSPDFEHNFSDVSALFIKGQGFYNIQLAYDIVSDQLILVRQFGAGLENRILLHPAFVDSFRIGNNLFVNLQNFPEQFPFDGFYELVSTGEIKFLKRYSKKYIQIYDASNRGKYSPQTFNCYLLDTKSNLTLINNRIQFLKYFSDYKKMVRNYLNQNNIFFRKASNEQLKELMIFCNKLNDETN